MTVFLMQQALVHAKPKQAKISKSPYAASSEKGKIRLFVTSSPSSNLSEGFACFVGV